MTLGGNIFFLHFGVEGIFISKLFLSAYVSLFTVLSGTLTAINIERFSSKSKNSFLVKFIVSVIVFVICLMTFINIQTESFYSYVIRSFDPIKPIVGKYSMILIPEFGSLWELFEFFWISIILIYLLVSVGRIIMRGPENSVKEFFILAVFFLELFFFIIYVNAPQNFIAETIIFACCVPYFYYLINNENLDKDKLIKYIDILIFQDENMRENTLEDVNKRLTNILNNRRFQSRINTANNNWLEIPIKDVIDNVLEYFDGLIEVKN